MSQWKSFMLKCLKSLSALGIVLYLNGCGSDIEHAKTFYHMGDFSRSKKLFDRAIDNNPNSFEARYGYALSIQQLALKKKNNDSNDVEEWQDVVAAYEFSAKLGTAKSLQENYAFALFHYAFKLYSQNNLHEALAVLEKALKVEPHNKFNLNLNAVVEDALGHYAEAENSLEVLLALDADFLTAYLNLGNVLWKHGKEEDAIVTWQQGLLRSPGDTALTARLQHAILATTNP